MPENKKDPASLEQPLMSTGTTEAGFDMNPIKEKVVRKPKIGETTIGARATADHQP